MKNTSLPKSAFLAVTLLCNSRCVMCDIWQNKGRDFLPLDVYRRLPDSLEMIDITGGEPFLRNDIPELVAVLKETCSRARILITTHGFMTDKIQSQIVAILKADPDIAFRISLDGLGKMHEEIRRIPDAFQKVMATLRMLRGAGVRDLGVIFTLMDMNKHQLREVYDFCQKEKLQFSLNVAHDSPVYFGEGKAGLQPDPAAVKKDFDYIFWKQMMALNPKQWAKAWFNKYSHLYMNSHKRPIACGAGYNFFYMDSHANILVCHFKNWPIGNLNEKTFEEIWTSKEKQKYMPVAKGCQDCWMMCTTKDAIKDGKAAVLRTLPGLMRKALP